MTEYGIPATPHRGGGREPWRVKGGNKPAYVTVIGRPSRWGNPHPLGEPCPACPAGTVHPDREDAVAAYRRTEVTPELEAAARADLRGRVLDVLEDREQQGRSPEPPTSTVCSSAR